MDIIKPVMDIVKDVVPTVKKYVKYQICHNDYVNEFKEMQTKLERRRKDVAEGLRTQLMQPGKMTKHEVEAWLKEADQETAEKVVEDLICKGGCFTNICSSRQLDKRTQSLNEGIFKQGEKYTNAGVSLVIDDHSIKGVPLPVECSGRDDIQQQILEWLKRDQVTRIAVWGMGGVGKTTIMKQVHNQLLKQPKFHEVIWVKVSKDFDIIVQQKRKFDILKFQKRIASSLKLKLELEDHENETKIAGLISQRLGQGSFVLILDDVWEPFSLEDVGIPNLVEHNGCKLVLTTRLQDVARAMECEVISVNPLPLKEAEALFLKKVGSAVLSDGKITRDIEPFLKQILQKCDGVPLAIVTVARTMRGKLDPRSWKWALTKLSEFEGIVDSLKFSYECLESQCQECFLYCALYPEDYEIPREELIERWIEEGFIYEEGETRDTMNCKGHVMLEKLVDNCLLESVKNREEEDCVSMHDLFREMALDIRPQFLVKAGIALEKLPREDEWRENLLKVSLMKNYIKEIPSSMPSPKCRMLTTLLLSNNSISEIPKAFFEHMLGLKILDLSCNRTLCGLPSSISKLESLTTLLLCKCESLREVPSLSNLVGLKKLDLSWTSIEKLPQGLNMLTNLKYLGLGGRLSEIPDELLQNLCKLQHLIVNTHKKIKWEKIGSWGKLQNLEKLDLWNLDTLTMVFGEIEAAIESTPLPAGTFYPLQYINVYKCDKIKKLFSIRWLGYLWKLHTIEVHDCKELEEIIGFESKEREKVTLPKLESLRLIALPQLKSIYNNSNTILICDSIKKIEIQYCRNIESVFWSRFNSLPNLKYLYLFELESLKSLFDEEGEKVTLPKLESLRLIALPQLKSIHSSSNAILICDSIKKIEIQDCKNIESVFWSGFNPLPNLEYLYLSKLENLKSLFDEEGLDLSPLKPPTSFFSLKEIRVTNCNQLKKVFSSEWLLRYFQSLETIDIEQCSQMEELISSSTHEEEKVTLPKLQILELINLPKLKSICNRSNVLICDSMQILRIDSCFKLKRIPLNFPLLDNGQSSYPPSLKKIVVFPKQWWNSLEWDHPNATDILLPFCEFRWIL